MDMMKSFLSMKNINVNNSIFLKYGEFIQRKGHMDKEMDFRLVKTLKTDSFYLTFDFCPTSEIDRGVINWLIDNKIKATFFICAEWMSMNSGKDMSFIDNDLFTIGGHGFKHIDPLEQSDKEQLKDINLAIDFWKQNKKEIKWYRVPYGHFTDFGIQTLMSKGINCASWTGPVLDKKAKYIEDDVHKLSKKWISQYSKAGDIFVGHANGEGIKTLETLKELKHIAEDKQIKFDHLK